MKRRLIALLCIISMCMSLVTPAMAADVTKTEDETIQSNDIQEEPEIKEFSFSDDWNNPLYEDVISEKDSSQGAELSSSKLYSDGSDITYVSSKDEVASILREGLKNRTDIHLKQLLTNVSKEELK